MVFIFIAHLDEKDQLPIYQVTWWWNQRKKMSWPNKINKQRFIRLLSECLQQAECETRHAYGNSDVLIVQTAVQSAVSCQTILVGEDTDSLVHLCYHVQDDPCGIFFYPEMKTRTKKKQCWNIKYVQRVLGREVCNHLDVTLHLEYSALEKYLPSSTVVLITISEHRLKSVWMGIPHRTMLYLQEKLFWFANTRAYQVTP